jgi:hypothetical protein
MTKERLLQADPPTGKTNTTGNQRVQRSIDGLCYYNLTQQCQDCAAYRGNKTGIPTQAPLH